MIITIRNPLNNKSVTFVDTFDLTNPDVCVSTYKSGAYALNTNTFIMTSPPQGLDTIPNRENNYVSQWEENRAYFMSSAYQQVSNIRKVIIPFNNPGSGLNINQNTSQILFDAIVDCDDILLEMTIVDNAKNVFKTLVSPYEHPSGGGNTMLGVHIPSGTFTRYFEPVSVIIDATLDQYYCCSDCTAIKKYIIQPNQDVVLTKVAKSKTVEFLYKMNQSGRKYIIEGVRPGDVVDLNISSGSVFINGIDFSYKYDIIPEAIKPNDMVEILDDSLLINYIQESKIIHYGYIDWE
jgi:hypothetical protein